jgi:D-alanyl-D-alanine carboxypeptidase
MKVFIKTRKCLITILLFILINNLHAQSVSVFLDSMLNHTLDSVHNDMANKSLSAAIQMPNNFNWTHAIGISSTNPMVNANTNMVYLIGSVTKTMTSACILQLAEQNLLKLDDSIYHYTDTIQYINPNITIRQLLRHQSGIYDVLTNPQCFPILQGHPDSVWSADDLIQTFIQPPLFQPGANWSYSNTNYFLLGMIIQRVTGNPFYTELRNRFFTPLSMTSIATPSFETVTSPVAHVWIDITGDGIQDDAHSFYYNMLSLNSAGGAAGCYYSNAMDLSKWMRTYMRGDLLTPQMMNEAKATTTAPGFPGVTYGLGLMHKFFMGYEAYGHGGDLSYSATSWYFPQFDISISVLNNDNQITSWELGPIVDALLQTYIQWNLINALNENTNEKNKINVFPIPFSDKLHIYFPDELRTTDFSFEIIDVNGKCIYNAKAELFLTSHLTINDLGDVPPGFYILNIYENEKYTGSLKLVK